MNELAGLGVDSKQLLLIGLVALWTLPWKGVALWRAARSDHHAWFIAFLVIHTLGILEILYIFVFGKKKSAKEMPAGESTGA